MGQDPQPKIAIISNNLFTVTHELDWFSSLIEGEIFASLR